MRKKREIRPFSSGRIKPVKTRYEQCELSDTVKKERKSYPIFPTLKRANEFLSFSEIFYENINEYFALFMHFTHLRENLKCYN